MIVESANFEYPGVPLKQYKDNPGSWLSVTRRELFPDAQTAFETRYFEVQTGGYTSFEHHGHEHCVVIVRGLGSVRLGDKWQDLKVGDAVRVSSMTPHQFKNRGDEPFGFICMVDRDRDRPILLDSEGNPKASNN